MPRKNPIPVGMHPSLFGGETPVYADWRTLSPAQIERVVARGAMPADDWNDMVDASELSESELIQDGVNPELAFALENGFMERLEEVDEEGREERIKPVVEAIRQQALAEIERYEGEGDEAEAYLDIFQQDLPATASSLARELLQAFEKEGVDVEGVSIGMMVEALSDPAIYEITVSKDLYDRIPPGASTIHIGPTESMTYLTGLDLKNLSDEDVKAVVKQLEDESPFITFDREPVTARDLRERAFSIGETDSWRFVFSPDTTAVIETLDRLTGASRRAPGAEPYNTIYRYAGNNSTVAGASAKGMHVAALRPEELRPIGAALGICVGRRDMPYTRRLIAMEIELYAILTEADKPKFCIERESYRFTDTPRILQVKGAANRLPGFEPKSTVLTKPDEVRLVVEFLQSLGYSDTDIAASRDIGPGVRTMVENGIIPFVPPPVKQRRLKENPGLMPSAATAAMIREDYAHPWGGRWGT
jgi:hypothetical protein